MRKMKRFLGLLLAAVMILAMNITVFAEEGYTITINNKKTGHTYEAYQVFTGDLSVDEETKTATLSNIKWGSGVNGSGIFEDLKADETLGALFTDCKTAADVAEVLEGKDADFMKAFADIVGQRLGTCAGTSTAGKECYTISGLAAGYYLVKDKDSSITGNDAYTDFILQVVKSVEVTPKSDVPTVEKKVKEDDKYTEDGGYGQGYNDVADWNIGDQVPFKLIGTLPDNYADYSIYKYIFHDTLSAGLTLNEDSIKVYYADDKAGDQKTEIDATYYNVASSGIKDECSFEISFANLKSVTGVTKDTYIIVEYTAQLNTNAEIGLSGNPNKVYLEFSNNPNTGGAEDTGTTPEDRVIVFTYELDVTKVDGSDTNKKLEGAEFKLYDDKTKKYVRVNDDGYVTEWTADEKQGSVLTSDESGLFKVIGLDDGTYYLKETKAPDGYNLIPDPIKLTITATTANNQAWAGTADTALTGLTIAVGESTTPGDTSTGIVGIQVENNRGSVLPTTGSIGTTIFYVLGGILFLGAGILLIARKRADSKK